MKYVLPMIAVSALCAGWVLVQRWIARRDADIGGRIERHHAGGCGADCRHRDRDGQCASHCADDDASHASQRD